MKFKTLARSLLSLSLSLSLSLVFSLCAGMVAHAADSTLFNPVPISINASAAGGGVPVGTVVAWPVAANPSDADFWLECNGQSTAGYPELTAVIGAAVPDLRGKFLRGLGGNSAALGVAQGDAIRNITGQLGETILEGGMSGAFYPTVVLHGRGHPVGGQTSGFVSLDASRVVPTANENRPVNMAVRYLIRARP